MGPWRGDELVLIITNDTRNSPAGVRRPTEKDHYEFWAPQRKTNDGSAFIRVEVICQLQGSKIITNVRFDGSRREERERKILMVNVRIRHKRRRKKARVDKIYAVKDYQRKAASRYINKWLIGLCRTAEKTRGVIIKGATNEMGLRLPRRRFRRILMSVIGWLCGRVGR